MHRATTRQHRQTEAHIALASLHTDLLLLQTDNPRSLLASLLSLAFLRYDPDVASYPTKDGSCALVKLPGPMLVPAPWVMLGFAPRNARCAPSVVALPAPCSAEPG